MKLDCRECGSTLRRFTPPKMANGQHSWRTPGLSAAAIVTIPLTLFPTISCQEATQRQYDTPEGLRSSRPVVEVWAERLRLRCTDPDPSINHNGQPVRVAPGAPCTEWRGDEPEVIADLRGSVVTIDSTHDYLCSGPW